MSLKHAGKQMKGRNGMMMISNYVEAVERGLDELDVLGLDGEAEWLQHQLVLRPVEHAPSRRERLRDDRALCLSPLDAFYNDMSPTQRPPQLHHQPPRDPNAREEREERGRTHAPRYDWMDCCSAANLPRLAAHSLSMASKARVMNPPTASAMAMDLSSGRGDRRRGLVRSEEGEWAWDGEGTRSGGAQDLKEEETESPR